VTTTTSSAPSTPRSSTRCLRANSSDPEGAARRPRHVPPPVADPRGGRPARADPGHRYALPGGWTSSWACCACIRTATGSSSRGRARSRDGDVYVAPSHLKEAMHGDRWRPRRAAVGAAAREGASSASSSAATSASRPVEFDRAGGAPWAHEKRMVQASPFAADQRMAAAGDLVEVEITHWPTATRGPSAGSSKCSGRSISRASTRVHHPQARIPDEHTDEAVTKRRGSGQRCARTTSDGRRTSRLADGDD